MKKAFLYSLKHSVPILISFIPVGLAYGILMQSTGRSILCTGACSLFVFAGSLQFLMVEFFAGGTTLLSVIILSLRLFFRRSRRRCPPPSGCCSLAPPALFFLLC